MANNFTINGLDFDSAYISKDYVYSSLDRNLWAWGINDLGQLGLNNTTRYSSPVQVGALNDWRLVSCARYMASAIKRDGTLWSWGSNGYGELGLNNMTSYSSPVQVGALNDWNYLYAGYNNILAIKTNGTLWSWGRNNYGQLGLGNRTQYSSPVQVGTLTNWSLFSSARYHSLATKTDGTLWAWGNNGNGELGLNTTTHRSSPTQVGALTNWSSVSTSLYNSMAIKTDGTLWSWGANYYGKLGLNTSGDYYSSPVQVGALTNWSLASTGAFHTAAIKTDGTLWSWGRNDYGQLGLGNKTDYSSPVQVGTLTNWSSVVVGHSVYDTGKFTLAVKTDGTLWSWGRNNYGQLGLGNRTNYSSPVQVGTLTSWISLSASTNRAMAVKRFL